MINNINILAIAPYESMGVSLKNVATQYDNIKISVFVGDLEEGALIAKRKFYNNYDAIISRGGTASLLKKLLDIPVVEIPVTANDILVSLKLVNANSKKVAIIGFSNIVESAISLKSIVDFNFDLYPIQSEEELKTTLIEIEDIGYDTILCDYISFKTAKNYNFSVFLINSGEHSLCSAIMETIRLCENHYKLRDENRFIRKILWNKVIKIAVFNQDGKLFFSTLEDEKVDIINYLQEQTTEKTFKTKIKLIKQIENIQYTINIKKEEFQNEEYIIYYFSERKISPSDLERGIEILNLDKIEEQVNESFFKIIGLDFNDFHFEDLEYEKIIVFEGAIGSKVEDYAKYYYINSTLREKPLIEIDCSILNKKSRDYLINHFNSPLLDEGNVLFLKNLDVLDDEYLGELLSNIKGMNTSEYNNIIITYRDNSIDSAILNRFFEEQPLIYFKTKSINELKNRIPQMLENYINYLNMKVANKFKWIELAAVNQLKRFHWNYDFAQFERVVKEIVLLSKNEIIKEDFVKERLEIEEYKKDSEMEILGTKDKINIFQNMEKTNREILNLVLEKVDGNKTRASEILGLSRTTIWRMLN